MKTIKIGKTGLTTLQNGFGALPIQRVDIATAEHLLLKAYEGGMTFFDTARAYSDSEQKMGVALKHVRDRIIIATKTMAKTPEKFWEDLHQSLKLLQTDHIDIYQFHCVPEVYRPGDGTGMYECMLEAKEKGLIGHIAMTAHKYKLAIEGAESGLYETIQYPICYLTDEMELELMDVCAKNDVTVLAMKGMAGGLITDSKAAMAFMTQYDNIIPIWGVQRESELDEWLSYMDNTPCMNDGIRAFIKKEREELAGDFCRGCGYCYPCPAGIQINNCARMSLLLRRAPSRAWLTEKVQAEMKKIEGCLHCNACSRRCPYGLDTPALLQKNYEDYKKVLSGEVSV